MSGIFRALVDVSAPKKLNKTIKTSLYASKFSEFSIFWSEWMKEPFQANEFWGKVGGSYKSSLSTITVEKFSRQKLFPSPYLELLLWWALHDTARTYLVSSYMEAQDCDLVFSRLLWLAPLLFYQITYLSPHYAIASVAIDCRDT